MKRRVGGIDEFMFKPLTVSAQPNITIVISGWLSNDDNSKMPFFTYLLKLVRRIGLL